MFVFKDFLIFLKTPGSSEQINMNSFPNFIKLVWKSICVLLIFDVVLGLLIILPLKLYSLYPSIKELELKQVNTLYIILVLPILEELLFRLPLRISINNILASLGIFIYILIRLCFFHSRVIAIFFSLALVLGLHQIIKKESDTVNSILGILKNRFWILFYIQALLFGFLHLTNYNLDFKYLYLFPLVAFSYIIPGIFWGYLRVRYSSGIYLCIVSHITVNSIYCLLILH